MIQEMLRVIICRKYAAHLESRSVGNAETEKAELAALEAEEAALSAELDTTSATLEKLEEDIEEEESRQATLGLEEKKWVQQRLFAVPCSVFQFAQEQLRSAYVSPLRRYPQLDRFLEHCYA